MLYKISQKQAANFIARLATSKTGARRIADYSNGKGENCQIVKCKITPHATYFEWTQLEPVFDGARCYYADAEKIEAVKNDRGDILRLVFHYNKFMISYEQA